MPRNRPWRSRGRKRKEDEEEEEEEAAMVWTDWTG